MNSKINEKNSLKRESCSIDSLSEQILSLGLLEAAELAKKLEDQLGLMPMGSYAHPAQNSVGSSSEAPVEKTKYKVSLEEFDSNKKIPIVGIIRKIRERCNHGESDLKSVANFIKSLPGCVVSDVSEEEAKKIKDELIDAGASKVKLE